MTRWQRFLHEASRSRRFLWRFAFAMLGLGVVLGYALHRWRPSPPERMIDRIGAIVRQGSPLHAGGPDMALDPTPLLLVALQAELADPQLPFEAVLDFMPVLATSGPSARGADVLALLGTRFPHEQAVLAVDAFDACRDGDAAAGQRLAAAAAAEPPVRFASHALGLAAFARTEFHAAHDHFRREGRLPAAESSRRRAVECLVAARDFAALDALQGEPGYAGLIPASAVLAGAIDRRDWPEILRTVPRAQFTGLDPAITALTLAAGLAWAFFLGHLGEVPRLRSGLALLCLLGFAAGVVSTTPTIYAVIWQDEMLGFSPEGDFLRAAAYYTGGVGVREEVCKLLLFVPLLPWLIRRGDELDAFAVASFVGLGFAIEENGNYFLNTAGMAAAGRFLTANFFHIALTGLNGLALFRACTRGAAGVNELLYVLGVTIIAHGLYDALISLPDATIGGFLSLAVYIITCQFYFHRAHELRGNVRMTVSLTGAFVAGISLLACAMIVFQMTRLGPAAGLNVVLPEFIGTIVLLVMFFREFDEPLSA